MRVFLKKLAMSLAIVAGYFVLMMFVLGAGVNILAFG